MKQLIVTDINFLRKRSEKVDKERALGIFCILEDSLDIEKGCGLSAVQIGILLKVAIIRLPNFKLNLWNPKIIEKNHPFRFMGERCLSLPGLSIDTKRYQNIIIENGDTNKYILSGLQAVAVLHEIDHLNGILILDRKWRKRK